jgi:hypothetical protein
VAGYVLYSLDWDRFQGLVNNPTRKQLLKFSELISNGLHRHDREIQDGDPVHDWPSEPVELCDLVKDRLARLDWYGDLSNVGKDIWCSAVFSFCSSTGRDAVGFRVEHDGIYWDVLVLAHKLLKLPPNRFSPDVALSAFGERAYRYHPPTDVAADFFAWRPTHSMHTPDEVRTMLAELRSIGLAIENTTDKQAVRGYDSLISVLEKLDKQRRMLFVHVDT